MAVALDSSRKIQSKMAQPFQPLVRPLPNWMTPEYCFARLSRLPGCVWLDSSLRAGARPAADSEKELTRYSYMAADPFSIFRVEHRNTHVLKQLQGLSQRYLQPALDWLPPMQGGWMGWFGYELGSCFESIEVARHNEFSLPLASLGMMDVVLSWDHVADQGWIVSQGLPAREHGDRTKRAYQRLKFFLEHLENVDPLPPRRSCHHALSKTRLAPQFETRCKGWTSNFSSYNYREAVGRVVEYIREGDIFQANLSQRLLTKAVSPPADLYQHLRQVSPAPFSGYADFGRVQVISSSPERFVQLHGTELETRPIKGTRPRMSDPAADKAMANMLVGSEKDRSENVMIVDLLRNDLSRVSKVDSVRVESLCGIEQYPFVWHLVSTLRSQLKEGYHATDAIAASFPGGSITGAPKIRAMEIIAELEPTVRGPYCGSLGYLSFAGDMDLNILIRTVTACEGWWQVPVGGGIVADSEPNLEEQETWHKAEGILHAIDTLDPSTTNRPSQA